MADEQHRRIVERWFDELFTQGNLAAVDELVAPDFVSHWPGGSGDSHGREALREFLRWYLATFTDREWTIDDIISAGDKAVVRYTGWTTYRGGWLNIPADNQRVRETGILIYRIEQGRVQELWSEMSDLLVAMQLGAPPTPKQSSQ